MNGQNDLPAAQPRLPAQLLSRPAGPVRDDDGLADCQIGPGAIPGGARRVSITRVRCRAVRLAGALPAAEMEDVVWDGCDLSNVDLSDAILLRVVFRNCRMTGVNFSGAALRDVSFEDDALPYGNFRFARMERTDFLRCNCSRADFLQLAPAKARFVHTDLRQAQMAGTSLAGLDLTTCNIDGLGARPEDLRGVILSAEQAVTAAKIVGVEIRF